MTAETQITGEYNLSVKRVAISGFMAPLLEQCQDIPHIHEVMKEPFDITNHAGNFWVGNIVAIGATLIAASPESTTPYGAIPEEKMGKFRKRTIPIILGATALLNLVTESRWGVKNLPIAEALNGPVPDPLDTLYSTMWSGLAATFIWKKSK